MIQSKIKSLFWFLSRPQFIPQAIQILKYRLFPNSREATRDASTEWCQARAISSKEAINSLLGSDSQEGFRELESEVYEQAKKEAESCPVKMGGAGDLDLLYHLAALTNVNHVVETGVAYGWSSLAILSGLANSKGRLISTDMPYLQMGNDKYVGCVVPEDLKTHWKIIRRADRQGLPVALEELGTLDMCHYDSDKTYAGRMWAYELLWNALRPGGYFVSDDIDDNLAFADFSEERSLVPVIVRPNNPNQPTKYVGVLVKPVS